MFGASLEEKSSLSFWFSGFAFGFKCLVFGPFGAF